MPEKPSQNNESNSPVNVYAALCVCIISFLVMLAWKSSLAGSISLIASGFIVYRLIYFSRTLHLTDFVLTIWVVFAILQSAAIYFCQPDYDAGNFGSLLVLSDAVWAFPLWVVSESFRNASITVGWVVPMMISVVCCVLLDVVRFFILRRRNRNESS